MSCFCLKFSNNSTLQAGPSIILVTVTITGFISWLSGSVLSPTQDFGLLHTRCCFLSLCPLQWVPLPGIFFLPICLTPTNSYIQRTSFLFFPCMLGQRMLSLFSQSSMHVFIYSFNTIMIVHFFFFFLIVHFYVCVLYQAVSFLRARAEF